VNPSSIDRFLDLAFGLDKNMEHTVFELWCTREYKWSILSIWKNMEEYGAVWSIMKQYGANGTI
jgi:hypothetical protein